MTKVSHNYNLSELDRNMLGTSLIRRLSSFRKNIGGNISIIAALSAVPLVAAAGVAIDYGRASSAITKMQAEVDAAALAAAAADDGTGAASAKNEARNVIGKAYLTGSLPSVPGITLSGSPTVSASVSAKTVDVTVTATMPISFAAVLFASGSSSSQPAAGGGGGGGSSPTLSGGKMTLTSHARAAWTDPVGPPACFTVLSAHATDAFFLDSDSQFSAGTCDVNVLSDANVAAKVVSSSSTSFQKVCAVGGVIAQGGSAGVHLTANCNAGTDPWAGYMPAVNVPGTCDMTGQTKTGTYTITPTLGQPYVFCGNNTLGGSKVTLSPGLYIIKDGLLTLSASTVIGIGVSFYFPATTSDIDYKGKEGNSLIAPTTGPYAGLLMFTGPLVAQHKVTMKDADKTYFEGIIYAPQWDLLWDSLSSWTEQSLASHMVSKLNLVVNTFRGKSISQVSLVPYTTTYPNGATASSTKTVFLIQ
jgi:Flp pilus assembly protein TadG